MGKLCLRTSGDGEKNTNWFQGIFRKGFSVAKKDGGKCACAPRPWPRWFSSWSRPMGPTFGETTRRMDVSTGAQEQSGARCRCNALECFPYECALPGLTARPHARPVVRASCGYDCSAKRRLRVQLVGAFYSPNARALDTQAAHTTAPSLQIQQPSVSSFTPRPAHNTHNPVLRAHTPHTPKENAPALFRRAS